MTLTIWKQELQPTGGSKTLRVPILPQGGREPILTHTYGGEQLAKEPNASPSLLQEILQLWESLRNHQVVIVQEPEVADYLKRHPQLIKPLDLYAATVRRAFPEASIEIAIYNDPEEDDEYLVLYVRYSEYPEGILDCIHEVRRQMRTTLRTLLGEDSGLLFLTTDFQPPCAIRDSV